MNFENTCNCIVDYKILEQAILEECSRRNIKPKDEYKIYSFRGYAGISLKHDKESVHRIIGKYMIGMDFDRNIVVHHIDGNKFNNNISNLQIMKNSFHTKEHYPVQFVPISHFSNARKKAVKKIRRNDVTKDKVLKLYEQGLTYDEIASELHCGRTTVGRRIKCEIDKTQPPVQQ